MSKMGKLLLIFGITAFVSLMAFCISVAALGVSSENYSVSFFGNKIPFISIGGEKGIEFRDGETVYRFDSETGMTYEHTFDASALYGISIETASAHTTLTCSDTDKAYVKYTAGGAALGFSAKMQNGRLTISEHTSGLFSSGIGNIKSAELEISLPEKMYNDVNIAVASGSMKASRLTSDNMSVELASGSLDLNVYAKNISFSAASGHGIFTNCTDMAAERIAVHTASGSQEVYGFRAAETEIGTASGKVTVSGISGAVDADVTSGSLYLVYDEWNDDLDIDLTSGKIDVQLPEGSGIDLDFERSSGGMSIDLDGTHVSLNKDSSGSYGGSNVHKAEIDVTSGSVAIHN